MTRELAIVGGAPHGKEAPFDNPDCEVWACSPNVLDLDIPRWDAWFEVHDPGRIARLVIEDPVYARHLATDHGEGRTIYTHGIAGGDAGIPNAEPFPFDEVFAEFGREMFMFPGGSTVAYMQAFGILRHPDRQHGLYGVDMASNEEYRDQWFVCRHFIKEAERRGIEVVIHPDSKLLVNRRLYGFPADAVEKEIARQAALLNERAQKHRQAMEAHGRETARLEAGVAALRDAGLANYGVDPTK